MEFSPNKWIFSTVDKWIFRKWNFWLSGLERTIQSNPLILWKRDMRPGDGRDLPQVTQQGKITALGRILSAN